MWMAQETLCIIVRGLQEAHVHGNICGLSLLLQCEQINPGNNEEGKSTVIKVDTGGSWNNT